MPAKRRHRLRLTKLRLLSGVDTPAQETASVRLWKRDGQVNVRGDFRAVKTSEPLGVVFGYAFTSTKRGADYYDLQGDQVVSDDTMIEVALDFVHDGAPADEMHDGIPTGSVPFVMPMTDDIAKAFGIEGAETGLMVGMKPAPDVFAKFVSGELAGFSIEGLGVREPVDDETETAKRAVMTNDVDGHSHLIYDDTEQAGETSYSVSEGDDSGHGHPWVKLDDGTIVIGAAAGHSHSLIGVGKSLKTPKGADKPPVQKTADATQSQETAMDEKLKKMEAELALAKAYGQLNDDEKAHAAALDESDREAFVKASKSERTAALAAAAEADPVVYTAADGTEYRKSAGAIVDAIKRADAAEAAAKTEREHREGLELRKRADDEMGNMPGDVADRALLLKAVDAIADDEARKRVTEILHAHNEAMADAFKRAGTTGAGDENDPESKLNELAQKRAEDKGEAFGVAYNAILKTAEGQRLYAEHRAN